MVGKGRSVRATSHSTSALTTSAATAPMPSSAIRSSQPSRMARDASASTTSVAPPSSNCCRCGTG